MADTMRAILLMIIAMFFFTVADLFVKLSSQTIPSAQVVTIMGGGTAIIFYLLTIRQSIALFQASHRHWTVFLRAAGEVIAAYGIMASLAVVPLASVTAIMQSQPLLLTMAGALFLGEKVGIRRISAVLIGLVGVMFILRPGMAEFSFHSWLVIIGVIGMTIRDLGSRIVPRTIPTTAIAFYGAVATTIIGGLLMAYEGRVIAPEGVTWVYLIAMVFAGTAGVFFITMAMRLGELSVVSPFRYVKIVFGMGAGIVIFGESLDGPTIFGTILVISAGLYAFMRERSLYRQSPTASQR